MCDFFILGHDSRVQNIVINNLSQITGLRKAINGDYSELESASVVFINKHKNHIFSDILSFQIFMVSEQMKKIFDLFVGENNYSICCLLDQQTEEFAYYYIPFIKYIYIDTQEDYENINNILKGRHITYIKYKNKATLYISLILAEQVMAIDSYGITIKKLISEV